MDWIGSVCEKEKCGKNVATKRAEFFFLSLILIEMHRLYFATLLAVVLAVSADYPMEAGPGCTVTTVKYNSSAFSSECDLAV